MAEPNQIPPGSAASSTTPTPASNPSPVDAAAHTKLQADFAAAQSRLKAFEDAESKRKADIEAEGDARKQLAERQKELDAEKAARAALAGDAALGKTYREQIVSRVATARKEMPAEWQSLLDAVGADNLVGQEAVVARFVASKTAAPQPGTPPTPGTPPPPGGAGMDVDSLRRSGMSVDEIKRKHPQVWAAYSAASAKPRIHDGIAARFARQ